jgi:hypothetical protein
MEAHLLHGATVYIAATLADQDGDFSPLLSGAVGRLSAEHGRAVQVDPNKPTLKAPGSKRLKLEYDKLLSGFAFNLNLRRYSTGRCEAPL